MVSYPNVDAIDPANLVPEDQQPDYLPLPDCSVDQQINLCNEILDRHVHAGRGDKVAIYFADEERELSFAELLSEVEQLAGALKGAGLELGQRVGIRYPNRPEATIAMLAVWRAGGVVALVPGHARASEIPFYVNDAQAAFLITFDEGDYLSEVEKCADEIQETVVIAHPHNATSGFLSASDLIKQYDPLEAPVLVSADMPSVLWHTGGTTGTPKCCYHTAGQFLTAGYAAARAFEVSPDDVHMGFPGPVGHAAGMLGRTNVSLLHGVSVVEVQRMADPEALLNAMSKYRVTWVMAIATTWAGMLRVYRENPDRFDMSSLEKAYAPMLSAVSDQIHKGWADLGIWIQNPMGSTQFGTWFMVPPPGAHLEPGCVGVPSPGYEATIIAADSSEFEELASDEIGLLAVRGPSGLTYWNRPELQRRDVRSGWTVLDDLARKDEAGYFWYLGRSDFMISTAGFKVAPVEVEECLGKHAAVAEVSVIGLPDPDRGEVVAAWIVPAEGHQPGDDLTRELQSYVKDSISPYKYPRKIVFTEELPRDPVGKIQVRDLRERGQHLDFGTQRYVVVE